MESMMGDSITVNSLLLGEMCGHKPNPYSVVKEVYAHTRLGQIDYVTRVSNELVKAGPVCDGTSWDEVARTTTKLTGSAGRTSRRQPP